MLQETLISVTNALCREPKGSLEQLPRRVATLLDSVMNAVNRRGLSMRPVLGWGRGVLGICGAHSAPFT